MRFGTLDALYIKTNRVCDHTQAWEWKIYGCQKKISFCTYRSKAQKKRCHVPNEQLLKSTKG